MSDIFNGPLLVAIGLASALVFGCLALAFGDGAGDRLRKRAMRLSARSRGETQVALSLRRVTEGGLDALIRRLLPRPELLRQRLVRTGRSWGLGGYAIGSVLTAIIAAIGAILLGLSLTTSSLLGLVLGLWLPHAFVGRTINRRIKRFETFFPEAIGLMVRGLRSGLPISESFQVVGREIGDPVGEEFRRISDQIRLGQALETALWDTARRIGTPEFNFLVVTMVVQRETGGNLAETLENLDQMLRRRRQMKLKIKAMSAEARASAMIIGSLPFIMFGLMFLVNSGYVMTLVTTHAGNILLAAGLTSMTIGIAVIAKMVRFEI
ncbi:MAG: type II secretion system F family protein [Alphaproteobacteria bacterium]|nr:type II secretion system F family protein [Alphaproteobacteria bacterium]